MNPRSPLAQLGVFVLLLIVLNIVLALLGSPVRISIIGSIVLSLVVGAIMGGLNRRR